VKPYQDITDLALAKALAHPLRTRILASLEGRTSSPNQLADELGAPLGNVSYHVRRLASLKLLKLVDSVPRRGAVEHYYTAVARPRITDQAWGAIPSVVKQATIVSSVNQIGTYVNAAVTDGGFEAPETHLTRSPVTVDQKGWQALARELERLTARVQKIEADSKARLARSDHGSEQEATVVLMLFHSPTAVQTDTATGNAHRPSTARRRRQAAAH
jgi:DNA-binding transcriptional ArsR family regulator